MKITNVRAITLKGDKDRNFVRIETDEGIMGLGEAHPGAGNHRCDCAAAQAFAHRYRSFFYVGPLYHHMIDQTTGQSVSGTMLGPLAG